MVRYTHLKKYFHKYFLFIYYENVEYFHVL